MSGLFEPPRQPEAENAEARERRAYEQGRARGRKDREYAQSGNVATGIVNADSTQSENQKLLDPNVPQSTKDDILRKRGML